MGDQRSAAPFRARARISSAPGDPPYVAVPYLDRMDLAYAAGRAGGTVPAAFNAANALGPWLAGMALAAGWGWQSSGMVAVGLSVAGLLALGIAWYQSRISGDVLHDCPAGM